RGPFPEAMTRFHELLQSLELAAGPAEDMSNAELAHGPGHPASSRQGGNRGAEMALLDEYRDHWINLDHGALSSEGRLTTSKTDVDRIFLQRLPKEIAKAK